MIVHHFTERLCTYIMYVDPDSGERVSEKTYVPYGCTCDCAKHTARSPIAHTTPCCVRCPHCHNDIAIEYLEKHMLRAHPEHRKRTA